jgi:hypothetical protein
MPEELQKGDAEVMKSNKPESIQEVSLDSIFTSLDSKQPTVEDLAKEEAQRKIDELKEKEEREKREKLQIERATFFARESGKLHYLQLADPKKYDENWRQLREDVNKPDLKYKEFIASGGRHKPFEENAEDSLGMRARLYGGGGTYNENDIRSGRMTVNFPQYLGVENNIGQINGPSDYLQALKDAVLSKIVKDEEELELLVDRRSKGIDYWNTGIPLGTQEERDVEVNRLKELKKKSRDQKILAVRMQAEGFGEAALEAGDLLVAMENLDFAGMLEKKDTIKKIQEVAVKLRGTEKGNEILKKSADFVKKIKERKEKQQKMAKIEEGL